MKRESFVFYRSFFDSIKELDPMDQVQIYNAIFNYQFEGKLVELNGICKSIFTLIIPQLEANNKKYQNGCKGGRPKNNQKETKIKPKNNQKETKIKPNENENDNVNDIIINNNIKEIDNKLSIKKVKYYEDEELNKLFLEFLEVRKKKKAINSERAIKMLMNKLSKYDDEIKYKMIEQSIINSWKDVYELKEQKKSSTDKMNEVFERFLAKED